VKDDLFFVITNCGTWQMSHYLHPQFLLGPGNLACQI